MLKAIITLNLIAGCTMFGPVTGPTVPAGPTISNTKVTSPGFFNPIRVRTPGYVTPEVTSPGFVDEALNN